MAGCQFPSSAASAVGTTCCPWSTLFVMRITSIVNVQYVFTVGVDAHYRRHDFSVHCTGNSEWTNDGVISGTISERHSMFTHLWFRFASDQQSGSPGCMLKFWLTVTPCQRHNVRPPGRQATLTLSPPGSVPPLWLDTFGQSQTNVWNHPGFLLFFNSSHCTSMAGCRGGWMAVIHKDC